MTVFNSSSKLLQRTRASRRVDALDYDYLRDEVASRLVGRLFDIQRKFPNALDLGGNSGNIAAQLLAQSKDEGSFPGGVKTLHVLEPCQGMLDRAASSHTAVEAAGLHVIPTLHPLEGGSLPYQDATLDMVMSSMALHWVNDVPGVLAEVLRVLKPDGVFICALLGGESLQELRYVDFQFRGPQPPV